MEGGNYINQSTLKNDSKDKQNFLHKLLLKHC